MGERGTFTKEELKRQVEQEDDIGKEIVQMQMAFLKAVSNGELSRMLAG